MGTVIFLITIVFVIFAYFYGKRKSKLEFEQRFYEREQLTLKQLCDLFSNEELSDRALIRELIEHAAKELDVPSSILRPLDRFEVELKCPNGWGFDSGQSILILELCSLAKKRRQPFNPSSIQTLQDYVNCMAKLYFPV